MHMLINVRNPPMTMSAVGCGPPKGSGEQIVDAAVFTIWTPIIKLSRNLSKIDLVLIEVKLFKLNQTQMCDMLL